MILLELALLVYNVASVQPKRSLICMSTTAGVCDPMIEKFLKMKMTFDCKTMNITDAECKMYTDLLGSLETIETYSNGNDLRKISKKTEFLKIVQIGPMDPYDFSVLPVNCIVDVVVMANAPKQLNVLAQSFFPDDIIQEEENENMLLANETDELSFDVMGATGRKVDWLSVYAPAINVFDSGLDCPFFTAQNLNFSFINGSKRIISGNVYIKSNHYSTYDKDFKRFLNLHIPFKDSEICLVSFSNRTVIIYETQGEDENTTCVEATMIPRNVFSGTLSTIGKVTSIILRLENTTRLIPSFNLSIQTPDTENGFGFLNTLLENETKPMVTFEGEWNELPSNTTLYIESLNGVDFGSSLPTSFQPIEAKPYVYVKTDPKSKGLTEGAIIGIAVGCGAFALIVIGLILFFVFRRKKFESDSHSY